MTEGTLVYDRGSGNRTLLAPVGDARFRMRDVGVNVEVWFELPDDGGKPTAMFVQVADGDPGRMLTVEPLEPTAEALQTYAGSYHSGELETNYTLTVTDGALVAGHRRHGPIVLTPSIRDRFRGNRWYFASLRFTRNAAGDIDGFFVFNDRSRNIRFDRR